MKGSMDRVQRGGSWTGSTGVYKTWTWGPCFVYVHHALSASMSLNTTEAVLQTQKHSETFVEKNIASYT